jgi:hypothetical protein
VWSDPKLSHEHGIHQHRRFNGLCSKPCYRWLPSASRRRAVAQYLTIAAYGCHLGAPAYNTFLLLGSGAILRGMLAGHADRNVSATGEEVLELELVVRNIEVDGEL